MRVPEQLVDLATIGASASAVALAAMLAFRPDPTPPDVTAPPVSRIQIENWEEYAAVGHRKGADHPTVTIVEFGDYQCPFCQQAHPHLDAILRRHPEVALVYRHLPLAIHDAAFSAARAAECAGAQDRFWSYHEVLYRDDAWSRDEDLFAEIAREAGVADQEAFTACFEGEEAALAVGRDLAAAQELGISGTPTFLINGRQHVGVIDSLAFPVVIQRILQ